MGTVKAPCERHFLPQQDNPTMPRMSYRMPAQVSADIFSFRKTAP